MKSIIKTVCLSLLLALALVSCKDEASIQNYFVAHQDLPDFKQIDLAANLVDLSDTELTEAQQETVKSFKKINFIGYKINDGDMVAYKVELEKAKQIFKNKKYSELMEFSSDGMKFRINTLGDDDTVDEILVLLSSKGTGFGIARVLGDDMNPEKMVELFNTIQSADVDNNQIKDLMSFFK
ncbi:DUF4252 domain-containing protein [Lacinutrix jangbogonensis]|uniref:DUF4252 domain-containing protein n=1 Tax=Lacinutrix jangbogonensis TaxID=1469557 RepID=UPI00053E1869|nr:DUF4252 domain-containing protein [Lacinutrix jangbogonensis]